MIDDLDFGVPTPPALGGELEGELGKLAPVAMRRPLRQLAILVGVSLVYGAGLLALITVRRDVDELPMTWFATAAGTWLLGFLVPAYLAIVPRAGSVLPRWQLGATVAAITSVGFVALGLCIHPHGPSSLDYSDTIAKGHWCLELGLATALVPVVAGAIFLRGALPVGSRWTAASLGAGGGALGGLVLHFHCRIADQIHVGVIHGGVVLVAALLAAALVPRVSSRA